MAPTVFAGAIRMLSEMIPNLGEFLSDEFTFFACYLLHETSVLT